MHDRRVHAAAAQGADRVIGRSGDGEQAARAESVEHRLGDAERRVASREHEAGRDRAREQPQLPGLHGAVRSSPARAGDAVVGELGGHELVGDAADAQRRAVAQAAAERRDDRGRAVGEELLDGRRQCPREAEGGIDGGGVAPGLDGGHELPADAGAVRQLGLRQPASQSALTHG